MRILGGLVSPLAAFTALAAAVAAGAVPRWDGDILRFAEDHYQSPTVWWLGVALDASIGLGVAIAALAVVLLLKRGRRRDAIFWLLAVGGAMALDVPFKELFRRPAPGGDGGGYSFPSGNAMASMAILLALALTASPRWRTRAFAIGLPILVAYGVLLVYAWWHYPTDVLGGWCAALAWVTASRLVLTRQERHSARARARRRAAPKASDCGRTSPPRVPRPAG
jgi:undecaprenyl-diphosphatase